MSRCTVTIEALKKIPLFESCNESTLQQLQRVLKQKSFPKGSEIVKCGAWAREMFIIIKGEVDIVSSNFCRIDREKEGSVFGELALIYSIPRTATVKAATTVEVFVLEKADFDYVRSQNPIIEQAVQDLAKERFSRFQYCLMELAYTPEGVPFRPYQVESFREIFFYFDHNQDGVLEKPELQQMLHRLSGKEFTTEEVQSVRPFFPNNSNPCSHTSHPHRMFHVFFLSRGNRRNKEKKGRLVRKFLVTEKFYFSNRFNFFSYFARFYLGWTRKGMKR
eukprot:TRINITY_DN4348_c0_g2_i9.p1 TRINITY_DN4348_c0_g2~~TRINITY_DN4348_c0_g2_i9.p1  ORF type:complete len:277 (-),score=48.62 TRINITY_DN4348_c0_g2_i9:747-1577(-)